jgi:large subunit ribosomal protein L15
MAFLHTLTRQQKRKKRVGRGGKRGTYSGRGSKGQKARAGRRIRPAIRDVIKKLPKKRGHRATYRRLRAVGINIVLLERFADGATVDARALLRHGIALRKNARPKILGAGALHKRLTIKGIAVSAAAREKIIAAGGTIAAHA